MVLRGRRETRVYEVGPRIAVGGMGEVYEGHAPDLGRSVAIKRVRRIPGLSDLKDLFFREVAIAAALEHPNVVEVIDAGSVDQELFLIMELVPGLSLAELMSAMARRNVRLPTATVCGIVAQVARGLGHAHERATPDGKPLGIIHRDVATENVLLSSAGLAKILDFGLATLTGHDLTNPGTLRGRPRALSPEQARGERLDARSDVFSLGALMFELASGEPLYTEQNLATLLFKVTQGDYGRFEARLPEPDPDLIAILRTALAVQPSARFRSARELERALDAFRAGRGMRIDASAIARVVERILPEAETTRRNAHEGPGEMEGTNLILSPDPIYDASAAGPRFEALPVERPTGSRDIVRPTRVITPQPKPKRAGAERGSESPLPRSRAVGETNTPPGPRARKGERPWLVLLGLVLLGATAVFVLVWGTAPRETPKDALSEQERRALVLPGRDD